MSGLMAEHFLHARLREASRLADEQMALVESIDDPNLKIAVALSALLGKYNTGDRADILWRSQTVIDLADGDPAKGNLLLDHRWRWRW